MLNAVSQAIQRTAQALTLRHPNAVDVAIYRKVSAPSAPATLGGAMWLTNEDRADYSLETVCMGRMLFLGHLQGAAYDNAAQGLTYNPEQIEVQAYIVPVAHLTARVALACELKRDDRVFWLLPHGAIEYQIKLVQSPTQLPPYVPVFVLEPLEHETDGTQMP